MCRKTRRTVMIGCAAVLLGGCGYTTYGLYPPEIHTVAVPIFTYNGLRRDIDISLTERVIQAIESRTPFKVVDEAHADTVLRGSIGEFYKHPFGEDGFDNPRGGNMLLSVRVSWVDNRSGHVLNEDTVPYLLQSMQTFSIDTGQSSTVAVHRAVDEMADQIVTLMQAPW